MVPGRGIKQSKLRVIRASEYPMLGCYTQRHKFTFSVGRAVHTHSLFLENQAMWSRGGVIECYKDCLTP